MRLKGKIALITGASVGIGRAESILFAKEGAKIVNAEINDVGGKETVEMVKAVGGECTYYHCDVTKAKEVKALIDKVIRKYGRIDILINDVGIPQRPTPVEEFPEELWDRVHDVNIKSVFLTTKYVVPYMKKNKGGVILNTSTMNSVRPHVGHVALTSAKNSVIAVTKELALELAPNKIRVNCISPWTIDTPSFQASLSEKEKRKWINEIPLKRVGKPDDIAYAALYLASDEASWVTGINLIVDGGYGI